MPTLVTIVSFLFQFYAFLILIRVLLSWVNTNPYQRRIDHPAIRILYEITDPVLRPLQRIIPPVAGTLDISPIVALIILEIARRIIVGFLSQAF
jgi:YggT family protein